MVLSGGKGVRWAGYVVRMGDLEMYTTLSVRKPDGKGSQRRSGHGRVDTKIGRQDVDWVRMANGRI
jgi:hypothetical protein